MQNGAPSHNAQSTVDFINSHASLAPEWLADSPDLNPIELVCGILKRKLKDIPRNERQTFETIDIFLNAIDQSIVDTLVEDFMRRCKLVKSLGRASISQYISSHIAKVPDQGVADPSSVRQWTPKGNAKLP